MKNRLIVATLALSLFGAMLSTPPAFGAETPVSNQSATNSSPEPAEPAASKDAARAAAFETDVAQPAEITPETSPTPNPATNPATNPVTQAPVPAAPQPSETVQDSTDPAPAATQEPSTPVPAPLLADTPEPPAPAKPLAAEIVVKGAVKVRWDSLNGQNGPLGAPLSNEKTNPGYIVQEFKGGFIYVDAGTGTHHIVATSAIGKVWYSGGKDAAKGFGVPVSDEIPAENGSYQKFSGGKWIFSTGLSLNTKGGIGSKWLAGGGPETLGVPTSNEMCALRDGGCLQGFKKTTIFWSPTSGSHAIHGGILGRYKTNGMQDGPVGYPVGPETCNLPQKGCFQNFQNGQILWVAGTGAFSIVNSPIRNHFNSQGGTAGFLMFPRGEQVCNQSDNGCYQNFQGGVAYNAKSTGAASVRNGKFLDGYQRRGWHNGILGFPKAQQVCGQPNGGCYQDFRYGRLWTNSAHSNAYATQGGIGSQYMAQGGPSGYLGYPISDERCSGSQCVQTFVGGHIGWGSDGAGGSYVMSECQNLNNGRSRYTTGGANRVLLTFTNSYNQAYATVIYCKKVAAIYVTDWKTDGYVGASGFKAPGVPSGPTRNLFSPTGSFTVTEAFGLGNPGTKLPYRTLNPNSRWGGNPWTPTYNKYHESNSWVGWDENMWYFATRAQHDYQQGAVIDYNRPDITQDAGFAIFLHENKVPTAGCISVDDWAMVDFLRKATSGDRIIMGVKSALFS